MRGRVPLRATAVALLLVLLLVTPAAAEQQTLADVFERVYRSVVVIRTIERDVPAAEGELPASVPALGSGVLVSTDGTVLTAAHLVHAASAIRVEFWTGERVSARVVASEPSADVSTLRLDRVPAGAVAVPLADSDRARVGDPIFVVGTPYGISHTLTVGHVSGRHKPGSVGGHFELAEFFQTDAAINQGNSGGPMFNMGGEVLGIVSHLITKSGGFEGLGFVVTSNAARQLVLEGRSPWHGVDGVLLEGEMLNVFNVPAPGMLVQRVVENSPAEKIGLRGGFMKAVVGERTLVVGGDIVLKIQGIPVIEIVRRRHSIPLLKSGDAVVITVLRAGRVEDLVLLWP